MSCFNIAKYYLAYHARNKYNQKVIAPNNISIVVNSYNRLFNVFIIIPYYLHCKYTN